MVTKAVLGSAFGLALCEHLNLDPSNVIEIKVHNDINEVFNASIHVALSADDLVNVGKIMKQKE